MNLNNIKRVFYSNICFCCNNYCKNCISSSVKLKINRFLTPDIFEKTVLDFNITNNDIWNINGGEPTMSPFISDIIKICHAASKHIILYTNGRLLANLPMDIISMTERIIVPIYGCETTHDKYVRVSGAFHQTYYSLIPILQRFPEKVNIKLLLLEDTLNIENLISSAYWKWLSRGEHMSVTRVLQNFSSNTPPTDMLSHRAEKLIKYFMSINKKLRVFDIPVCQLSSELQSTFSKIQYENLPKVIMIENLSRYAYPNYCKPTDYKPECKSCLLSKSCVKIMQNYFCPLIENSCVYCSTE